MRTYPCAGTTGTLANSQRESPSPFPNEADPIWGHPIMVYGDATLSIVSASVTGPSGSVAIKAIYGDGTGATADPAPAAILKNGTAAITPTSLRTNTTYAVTVTGFNKRTPFTSQFSFTTGPFTADGYFATEAH